MVSPSPAVSVSVPPETDIVGVAQPAVACTPMAYAFLSSTKLSNITRYSATSPSMPSGFFWMRMVWFFTGSTLAPLRKITKLTPAGR